MLGMQVKYSEEKPFGVQVNHPIAMEERKYPYSTTIEIDCDPWTGMGRQQLHYEAACKAAGLTPQKRISASFGCWTWPVTYESKRQQDIVKECLTDLYNEGRIRYASW